MKLLFYISTVILFFFVLYSYEAIPIEEQPDTITCGFYTETLQPIAVAPLKNEKVLEGNIGNDSFYISIKRVYTDMCRDKGKFPRYRIQLLLNNKEVFAVSHTDIPFAVNTYYKNNKYRIICVDNQP